MASSWTNRRSVSPCVARHLLPMAPWLAPQNLLTLANVRMDENSVDRLLLRRLTGDFRRPAAPERRPLDKFMQCRFQDRVKRTRGLSCGAGSCQGVSARGGSAARKGAGPR